MAKLKVYTDRVKGKINRNIYGHFAEHLGRCIYEGLWVGEDSPIPNTRGIRNDVLEALQKLRIPVLRWPGGCFADEYHWQDGIGPRETRKRMINTNWGGVVENNHFGTHEFFDLCELMGCEPYITGNVGSGTVREMQEWIEYIHFDGESPMANLRRVNGREAPWKLKYFGVGNENWGCGGQMRPEYYADLYRQYQSYTKQYGDRRLYKIACGPNSDDTAWMEVVLREAGRFMDGISLHYYTIPGDHWSDKGSATRFGEEQWFTVMQRTLKMEELLQKHSTIMDRYDPEKRIGLIVDEWGTWYDVEPETNPGFLYQQNTMRDAVAAGINLNLFNQHCERVQMANIAQTVNVLQAMVLTEGSKMLVTPTYHVFDLYQAHQDAQLLDTVLECDMYELGGRQLPQLHISASKDAAEKLCITVCNLSPNSADPLTIDLAGFASGKLYGWALTASAMNSHNTFEQPEAVTPVTMESISITEHGFAAEIPPMAVVKFSVEPAI